MIVKDLSKMEKIVKNHTNLIWSGWDVVELKRTNQGRTSVDGLRVGDVWYTKKTFVPTRNGWDIPSRYQV